MAPNSRIPDPHTVCITQVGDEQAVCVVEMEAFHALLRIVVLLTSSSLDIAWVILLRTSVFSHLLTPPVGANGLERRTYPEATVMRGAW